MDALYGIGSSLTGPWRVVRERLGRSWRRVREASQPELFPVPWPDNGPSLADFRSVLDCAELGPSRVGADALHLVRLAPGVCKQQAARDLLSQGFRARSDTPPFALKLPIDWSANPYRDDNWCVQLNMLRLLDPLIHAHEDNGDSAALATALAFCLDWHAFHQGPRRNHPWSWCDMMTGLRSLRLAYLAEAVRTGRLGARLSQRDALAAMMFGHWRRMTSLGFFRFTNHTIWDVHGLCALTRVVFDEADARRADWLRAIGARLDHLVQCQFDARGLHRENSPQYHFVAASMLRTLRRTGWYEQTSAHLAPTLARARALNHWMRLPDGRVLPIGDSDGSAPTLGRLPEPSRRRADDHSARFSHGGYCIVHRRSKVPDGRWSTLAMRVGFDSRTHKHHDLMSYLWSESGCDIVVDPGKYAYDSSPLRNYFRSNRAHNLIEFGGRDCDTRTGDQAAHYVHELATQPWGQTIVARLRHHPVDVVHERTIHFAPGQWIVIVDRYVAADAVDFVHLTHLAPEFSAVAGNAAFEVRHADGAELGVAHWSSVDTVPTVVQAVAGERPQGWVSRAYRQAQPCPTLTLAGRAEKASLVIALSLDARFGLRATADGLEWQCGRRVALEVQDLPPFEEAATLPGFDVHIPKHELEPAC